MNEFILITNRHHCHQPLAFTKCYSSRAFEITSWAVSHMLTNERVMVPHLTHVISNMWLLHYCRDIICIIEANRLIFLSDKFSLRMLRQGALRLELHYGEHNNPQTNLYSFTSFTTNSIYISLWYLYSWTVSCFCFFGKTQFQDF
jgi:hypothetical protein